MKNKNTKKETKNKNIKYSFYYPKVEGVISGDTQDCLYNTREEAHAAAKKLNDDFGYYRIVKIEVEDKVYELGQRSISNEIIWTTY